VIATEDVTDPRPGPPAFPRVEVPGAGVLSLATLDELRDARDSARANADHLARQAAELEGQAEDRLAQAGALLVSRQPRWDVPDDLSPLLARAERLVLRISGLDERTAGLEPGVRPGRNALDPAPTLRGWWSRVLRGQRSRSAARLRHALVLIAEAGAGMDVPGVEPLLDDAAELWGRAAGLRRALTSVASRLGTLDHEIAVREEAQRRLGVDALHLAAYARAHGLPAVPCPFELEPGEVAHLVLEAALARMPAGGQQPRGSSEPGVAVAHTGILQWVGRLRNDPAPRTDAGGADTGFLVVSNLRLLFAGHAGSVVVPLTGVVDADVFTDGIAVFRLGREAPDLFLVAAPRLLALYLNWALSALVG
jgi:hypothetical protein